MEELFRLMLQRPAIAQDQTNPSIDLSQDTPYQQAVRTALKSGTPAADLATASLAYVASAGFIGTPPANPYAGNLAALESALAALDPVNPTKVRAAVKAAFNANPGPLSKNGDFTAALTRLRDSIVAIKAVQEEHSRDIEGLI